MMNPFPNATVIDLIATAWIRKQIELLSIDALCTGTFVYETETDSICGLYLIEHENETICCSPEKAYAMLHFLIALDELKQQEALTASVSLPAISR